MSKASDTLVIGKIGAPYGVKGWTKITTYTEESTGVFDYSPWFIERGGEVQELQIDQWRTHNKGVVAKLVGVENRDEAEALKNLEISVKAEQLPELADDEFYWRDLINMQVVTDKGYDMGVVKELFETGSNDVMLVKAKHNDAFGQKERMIPFLMDQVIKKVDLQANVITVDWDPGF